MCCDQVGVLLLCSETVAQLGSYMVKEPSASKIGILKSRDGFEASLKKVV